LGAELHRRHLGKQKLGRRQDLDGLKENCACGLRSHREAKRNTNLFFWNQTAPHVIKGGKIVTSCIYGISPLAFLINFVITLELWAI
jgi:hypothetical protein